MDALSLHRRCKLGIRNIDLAGKLKRRAKGSIERHNGLIRRFVRKGHRIDEHSYEWIAGRNAVQCLASKNTWLQHN